MFLGVSVDDLIKKFHSLEVLRMLVKLVIMVHHHRSMKLEVILVAIGTLRNEEEKGMF